MYPHQLEQMEVTCNSQGKIVMKIPFMSERDARNLETKMKESKEVQQGFIRALEERGFENPKFVDAFPSCGEDTRVTEFLKPFDIDKILKRNENGEIEALDKENGRITLYLGACNKVEQFVQGLRESKDMQFAFCFVHGSNIKDPDFKGPITRLRVLSNTRSYTVPVEAYELVDYTQEEMDCIIDEMPVSLRGIVNAVLRKKRHTKMNAYQQQLYDNLIQLTKSTPAFSYKDSQLDDTTYRIFSYTLGSWGDFQLPSALECRGIMFEVSGERAIRLACMPMEKFFNLNENPSTTGLDLHDVVAIQLKSDGSLISSFRHTDGTIRLKSKTSLDSPQVVQATRWLGEHLGFLWTLASSGECTVNMEWVSPENRIVVGYQEPELRILNSRWLKTGAYNPEISAPALDIPDFPSFIWSIPDGIKDVEGYVLIFRNGQRVKVKTNWYLALHRVGRKLSNPRRIYEAILEETVDDMKSLFKDDPVELGKLEGMEERISAIYHETKAKVEDFWDVNHDRPRKDYAVFAQESLTPFQMKLAMIRFGGKQVNYKKELKLKYKEFGFEDTQKS